MAERTHNPNPAACIQWEMLLVDALDGILRPQEQALFAAHKSLCPACAALFEEARRGRQWLEFLSPDPEVPAGLLDRILAQTGPQTGLGQTGQMEAHGPVPAANNVLPTPQHWQRPSFMANLRRFSEPRLIMTAAMAFFSIALTLNLTGIHLNAVRRAGLRPISLRTIPGHARSFLERRLTMASTPVIRYYDHSRLIYEVESRVRQLRRATESDDSNQQNPNQVLPGESKQTPAHTDGRTREDSQQQSSKQPALNHSHEYLESSFKIQGPTPKFRRLQINTSALTANSGTNSVSHPSCHPERRSPRRPESKDLRFANLSHGWDTTEANSTNSCSLSTTATEPNKRSTPWIA